jgi:hypothetical protein
MHRWSSKLAYPVTAKDGRRLATLLDASQLILKLPPAVQERQVWQRAAELLIEAAEHGGSVEAATAQMHLALFLTGSLDLRATAPEAEAP